MSDIKYGSLRKLQENAPNSLTIFERHLDLLFGDDEDIPSLGWAFLTFSNSREEEAPYWTKLTSHLSPISMYQTEEPVGYWANYTQRNAKWAQGDMGFVRWGLISRIWRHFQEEACVFLVTARQTHMSRISGEATPGYCGGKPNGFCLCWLCSFTCFSSAAFRLIPFAKLSWQSWWQNLQQFWSCPGPVFSCSFLALELLSRNWLSRCRDWTKPNVKQNAGTPNQVGSRKAVRGSEGPGKGGASLEPDWIMLPSCQHTCSLRQIKGYIPFMLPSY